MNHPANDPSAGILVCILHYGDPALTLRLHRQLLTADPAWAAHIRVLDNAAPQSYSGAYAQDETAPPGVDKSLTQVWRRLPENLYWAGGLHAALESARQEGYTHLWFFNNDVVFTSPPPHLARAAERLRRLQAICGPVGVYAPAVESNPYHRQMVRKQAAQWSRVAYVDGIAPLLNLAAVDAVGGLDMGENIYGYGLDIWLSLRLAEAGWPVLVDHQVTLKHHYHATARRVEGFLATAAAAEQAFLTKRLGVDYKQRLRTLQEHSQDEYKI